MRLLRLAWQPKYHTVILAKNNRYLVSNTNNLLSGNHFYLHLIRLYEKQLQDKVFPFSDIGRHGSQIKSFHGDWPKFAHFQSTLSPNNKGVYEQFRCIYNFSINNICFTNIKNKKVYNVPNLRYHDNEKIEPSVNLHKNSIVKANCLYSAKVYINDSKNV